MDECEFLIYDILGKTPDKMTTNQEQAIFAENWMAGNEGEDAMDDESDEYMIDSDEDDEDDVSFDEMLFVPKIVFNDNIAGIEKEEMEHDSPQGTVAQVGNTRQSPSKQSMEKAEQSELMIKQEQLNKPSAIKNGGQMSVLNGNAQRQTYPNKCFSNAQQANIEYIGTGRSMVKCSPMPLSESGNFEQNSDQESELSPSSPRRYMNKFRELRLLDLEIENKVLKNRYMKLKIYQMEQNLGLEHCKEVKELSEFNNKVSSPQCKSMSTFANKNDQSNNEQMNNSHHKMNNLGQAKCNNNKLRT